MDKANSFDPIRTLLFLGGLLVVAGCGDVGGAGQCNNVEHSGICFTLDAIEPLDPEADAVRMSDVDAFFTDCDGDGIADEGMYSHPALLTLSARIQPGVVVPPAPAFVTWVNYSVFFTPNLSNGGVDPPLSGFERSMGSLLLESGATAEEEIELIPIATKSEYQLGGGSLAPPQNYTVTVTVEGLDQFNERVVVQGTTTVNFADFVRCS